MRNFLYFGTESSLVWKCCQWLVHAVLRSPSPFFCCLPVLPVQKHSLFQAERWAALPCTNTVSLLHSVPAQLLYCSSQFIYTPPFHINVETPIIIKWIDRKWGTQDWAIGVHFCVRSSIFRLPQVSCGRWKWRQEGPCWHIGKGHFNVSCWLIDQTSKEWSRGKCALKEEAPYQRIPVGNLKLD